LFTYVTGEHEGYYADYTGRLDDVARAIEQGFLYQGQRSPSTGKPRGTPVADEPARAFVFCTENHDQVGNRALGERLGHLIDHERYLVASAILLFAPETPLLFQGQEFAASAPFLYFTDHNPELGRLVTEGRRAEFRGFSAFADPARREQIPDPQAESTFLRSKLDLSERHCHADVYRAYKTLLALRRDDPVLRNQDRRATRARAVDDHLLLVHRWRDPEHRLLVANFGDEPAPLSSLVSQLPSLPPTSSWRLVWSGADVAVPKSVIEPSGARVSPRSAQILAATAS
jgi:maltooligosyltrehalose trehalohydrolase